MLKHIKLFFLAGTIAAISACSTATKPKIFKTPEEAVASLGQVVVSENPEDAKQLFGSKGEYLINSGDPVQDKLRKAEFAEMYNTNRDLESINDDTYFLLVGKYKWPFPVPIVKQSSGWKFDAEGAEEEIRARRVGSNELKAIATAQKLYLAQRIYAAKDRDGDGKASYASKIISSPGKKDGLFWPSDENSEPSPLGPVIAEAADESYVISGDGVPRPYYGYYYRFAGDTKGTISGNPRNDSYQLMIFPARWGESGVMSFMLNERGWLFEKDLGKDFNLSPGEVLVLDNTWRRVI